MCLSTFWSRKGKRDWHERANCQKARPPNLRTFPKGATVCPKAKLLVNSFVLPFFGSLGSTPIGRSTKSSSPFKSLWSITVLERQPLWRTSCGRNLPPQKFTRLYAFIVDCSWDTQRCSTLSPPSLLGGISKLPPELRREFWSYFMPELRPPTTKHPRAI